MAILMRCSADFMVCSHFLLNEKGRPAGRPFDARILLPGSAFGELEAASGLRLAVFLALDDTAVARQVAARLEHRAQARLVIGQGLADAVPHSAGLAREAAAYHRADDVILTDPLGDDEGLVHHHAQHRPGEIDRALAPVDQDLAASRLDPDAGNGVLSLPCRIGP